MADADSAAIRVVNNPEAKRYEIFVGDTLAGFTTYRLNPGTVVALHSEVFPEFEHHGLATILAQATLDDIRSQGLEVVPRCPFVAKYVKDHPEYADMVHHIA
jgi:predicted GNAT family acetyltransferase